MADDDGWRLRTRMTACRTNANTSPNCSNVNMGMDAMCWCHDRCMTCRAPQNTENSASLSSWSSWANPARASAKSADGRRDMDADVGGPRCGPGAVPEQHGQNRGRSDVSCRWITSTRYTFRADAANGNPSSSLDIFMSGGSVGSLFSARARYRNPMTRAPRMSVRGSMPWNPRVFQCAPVGAGSATPGWHAPQMDANKSSTSCPLVADACTSRLMVRTAACCAGEHSSS